MLNLIRVGVTGGIACGKSTVCRIFKSFGAYTVSADEIVHQLLSPDTNVGQQVMALFGPEIMTDHRIDRAKIAEKVFRQPQLLRSLESLIHPAVLNEIESLAKEVQRLQKAILFVAEIPLLFESGADTLFDAIVCVTADLAASMQRFCSATGYNEEEYYRRMANQLSQEEKAKRADYLIDNSGSLHDLQQQVQELYQKFSSMNQQPL